MKEDKKIFTIKKGQSIWLELKATEDVDLMECEDLCKIHFEDGGIDKLTSEQILLKSDVLTIAKEELAEKFTAVLLENDLLDRRYLVDKYCNGGGL